MDDVWEMALVDLTGLSKYNDGNKYVISFIDVFSRYVWNVPLKDKTGTSVTTALKTLFKSRQLLTLQLDKGSEF
jgi:hypothetical protein